MFDDCKGEKFLELLLAFSTLVVRKIVAHAKDGSDSIAGRLCLAEKIPREYQKSLIPLAIAHRAALKGILKRKGESRARYQELDHVLSVKEKELDRRFEKVVGTQTFLDQNIASEATVSRIAKQFDQHWQGDRRFIDVIAQGEESTMTDACLDVPFSTKVWPAVSGGTFVGDPTTSRHGLLEDLERRVVEQNERLQHWRDFKNKIQMKAGNASPSKPGNMKPSPTKASRTYVSKEKDLVFSPRKSPRKSEYPVVIAEESPPDDQVAAFLKQYSGIQASQLGEVLDNDSSGFSEIASQDVATRLQAHGKKVDLQSAEKPVARSPPRRGVFNSHEAMDPPSISWSPSEDVHEAPQGSSDEEEDLAEKIISRTLNAAPTPMKAPLSLIERTRQSMALASPGAKLSSQSIPHQPPQIHPDIPEHPPPDPHANLLERTRRSISLLPPKHKAPRASMHNRRSSKIYPTNQFETPRKMGMVAELTPPEELFSPGAGYDSVFKSRPKIAMSPTETPEPELVDETIESGDASLGGLEESPLARLTARV